MTPFTCTSTCTRPVPSSVRRAVLLFRVYPATGHTTTIELGDSLLLGGDGILLDGPDLYVVQGIFDQIKVVRLDAGLTSGTVVRTITSKSFDFPSTIAEFEGSLYVVNARFDDAPPPYSWPDEEFEVVRGRSTDGRTNESDGLRPRCREAYCQQAARQWGPAARRGS